MTTAHPPRPAVPAVQVSAPVQVPVEVPVSVADLIAAAVLACPSVAGLHGGRFGEVATYLPGRRVSGVRVTPGEVVVHLVGLYPAPVSDIDAQVRAAVHPHLGGLPLTVVVEDYAESVTTPAITPAVTAPPAVTAAQPCTAPVPSGPDTAAAEPSAAPPPARPARVTIAALTKEIL